MKEEKQTWFKSDLFAVWFCCMLAGVICLIGQLWIVGSSFILFSVLIGSINRSDARLTWVHPDLEEDLLEETGVSEASFLNPEHIPAYKDPPDLG